MTALLRELRHLILQEGPIPVARYMAICLGDPRHGYYATRDPLGAGGDFVTAPEISQMFGELIGLWLTDLWHRAGRLPAHYVELGPGRGTLAADARRAMRAAAFDPPVHLVEISPVLRAAQAKLVPDACWHHDLSSLPGDGALLVVANEFFDALPVRQLEATQSGWRERLVGHDGARFFPAPGPSVPDGLIPDTLRDAPPGTIVETSPAATAVAAGLAARLKAQGGAALIVDYGHARTGTGDTLQAVARHAFADPWADPGGRDLTAHVDFEALAASASGEGVRTFGPRAQGEWLEAMGIGARSAALSRSRPERADELAAARERLVAPGQMGDLFKAMALIAPGWPHPEGFA